MSTDTIQDREPLSVMVDLIDLWALQKTIKYNTFMYDSRTGRPMFPSKVVEYPSGPVNLHTSWRLRDKVNSLILRFVQEEVEDKRLPMPLDYDEAWYIDSVLSVESYNTARVLLIQVMQVIWEHEYGVSLKTDVMNKEKTGADGKFNPDDMIAFLSSRNAKESEGFYMIEKPEDEEEGADPTVV